LQNTSLGAHKCAYDADKRYIVESAMSTPQSIVFSMRLPAEAGRRLKRMALRHGWTASDASARLVEEGLRRFALCPSLSGRN